MRKTNFNWLLTLFVVFSFVFTSKADVCTQTFTATGHDDDPTTVTIAPGDLTCTGGGTINSITLLNTDGSFTNSNCGGWYDFTLIVDGTTIISNGCQSDFDNTSIDAGFSTIEVHSNDLDAYSDGVTITFDLEIDFTPPSCIAPSSLTATNITNNSAILSWVKGDSETNWNVEYMLTGVAQGSGTTIAATDTFANITGLTAQTTYDYYVQADCGGGDQSTWVGPYTFTTACDIITTFPWNESFEGGFAFDCWTNEGTSSYIWEVNDGSSHGPGSVTDGTDAVMFDVWDASRGNTATLTSPIFDLTSLSNPYFQFDFWMDGSADTDLWIKLEMSTDGSTWNQIYYQEQDGSINDWVSESLSLTGVTSTTTFRFIASSDYGSYNIFVDNLKIINITCPAPTALNAINIDGYSADLQWVSGGASNWNIVYGPQGFNMTDSTAIAVTDTFYNVTGLTPTTSYDFYVQDSCAVGDVSTWVGPYTFTTTESCPAPTGLTATTTPNSANTSWITGGSTNYNFVYGPQGFNMNDSTAIALTDTFYNISNLPSGTSYDFYVQDSCGVGDVSTWAGPYTFSTVNYGDNCEYALQVTLPADFTTNVYTDLSQTTVDRGNSSDTTCLGSYDNGEDIFYEITVTEDMWVKITMDPKSTSYTGIALTDDCPSSSNCIETVTNSNTNPRIMDNVFLAAGTYHIMIDTWPSPNNIADFDLTISRITCPVPTALNALNITGESADLSWTTGGSSTWNILFGEAGFDTTGLGPNAADITTNPLTVDTLQPETDYEFYVRDRCAVDDSSVWVGPYTFTTTAHCPNPTDLDAINITTTSADLAWNGYFATNWDILFGEAGFDTTGMALSANDITDNPLTIDTLQPATAYEFYVRADCGQNNIDTSLWVGPFAFHTECESVSSFPWLETFEYAGDAPMCWSQEYTNGTHDWIYIDGDGSLNAYEGNYNAAFKHIAYDDASKLITPTLDLSSVINPVVTFAHAQRAWSGDQDSLKLFYRISENDPWVMIPGAVWTNDIQDWTIDTVHLPNPSATYQIAFEGYDEYGHGVIVDSVVVRESPLTDLALIFPGNQDLADCSFTGQDTVPFFVKNVGNDTIVSGETIYAWYELDGGTAVADTFVLASDLNPTDTLFAEFTQTANLAGFTTHNYKVYFEYANDMNQVNDTTIGTVTHYQASVDLGATNDTLTVYSYPYTLDAGANFDSYLWNDGSTNSTLEVNADGWYNVFVTDSNDCEATDTVYVIYGCNLTVDLGAVNDTITVTAYPYTLDAGANYNSYLWNDGSTNQTLDVSVDGWYNIVVTDTNNCEATDTVFVVLPTGINTIENANLSIYPNPNNGMFTLTAKFNTNIDFTVEMVNLDGQTIYTKEFNGVNAINETIDVANYAKGIYYIRLTGNNVVKQEKVVIY